MNNWKSTGAAIWLFNLFSEYSKTETLVSDEGLEKMEKVFAAVPEDDRADVFTLFVELLDAHGYDHSQYQFGFTGKETEESE